jgi:hypothetical protein
MPSSAIRNAASQKYRSFSPKRQAPLALWLSGGLLSLAAFSSSWTAATIGGFNIVDYALAAAIVLALLAWVLKERTIIISFWMLMPTLGAILIAAADVFLNRGLSLQTIEIARLFISTTLIAIFARSEAEVGGLARTIRVVKWWAAGIVVNGLVAVLVSLGVVTTAGVLNQPTGDRLSGLSSHPNSIAFSISICLPVLVYLISQGSATRRQRFLWLIGLGVSIVGLLLANSRAGLIVGLVALALAALIALSQGKLRRLTLPLVILLGVVVWLFVIPALLGTRLGAGAGDLSNVGRVVFNEEALNEFLNSPVWGAGFDAQAGVSVPLQVLSAGGLLFAIAYYGFILAPVTRLLANRKSLLARYSIVVVIAILGFSLLNPVFSERATFWVPLMFAAGLTVPKPSDNSNDQDPWKASSQSQAAALPQLLSSAS